MKKILAALLCFMSLLVFTGCSTLFGSKRDDVAIYAPHSTSQLYGRLHDAELHGGRKVNQPHLHSIAVQYGVGTKESRCGWKGRHVLPSEDLNGDGKPDGIEGVEGGFYDGRGNITLYLQDGKLWEGSWECDPTTHEMQHFIYDTHGIPSKDHHRMMKEAGYTIDHY